MRTLARLPFIVLVSLLPACATTVTTKTESPADARAHLMARVQSLMNSYEKNDQDGVIALVDKRELTVLGTQVTEKVRTPDEFRAFMTRSFTQWKSAHFSALRDVDVRIGADLAAAYYVLSFSTEGGPTVPVRVVTTWRKDAGEWYLTQSASWVLEAY